MPVKSQVFPTLGSNRYLYSILGAGMAQRKKRQKTLRQRITKKTPRPRSSSPNAKANDFARLVRERDEALEQQAATTEVLKIISGSPGHLEPVFNAILENATRICEAKFGTLYRYDGGAFYPVTFHKVPSSLADFIRKRGSFVPPSGTPLDRLLRTKEVIRTADDSAEEVPSPSARLAGAKSHIGVPMFKDDELAGAIVIYRQEVRPFTDKQVKLVQSFAAQAVIAIENARLFNELKQSLEQQTATADVLKIISSSPGDLQPVFNAMLANATRICEAEYGFINEYKDGLFQNMAQLGGVPAYLEKIPHGPARRGPESVLGRIERTRQLVQIDNLSKTRGYAERDPLVVAAVEIGGVRTILGVPMFKDDELAGAVLLYRKEVRPFTDKQIDLIKNFAAQAVIAIENTRLLNELRQRTGDLSEALEQQTASSEVLKVISSSPGRLTPVFDAILANAVRLCVANFGTLWMAEKDDHFRSVASHAVPPALAEARRREPVVKFDPSTGLGRVIKTKQVLHVVDMSKDPAYLAGNPRAVTLVDLGGARTVIFTPMLKNNEAIGALTIYRQQVRPFTEKQIELIQNFAAQAVIAIENARLLNDLNKLNQQLEQRVKDQVSEIERIGRLRRFLPPQVADLIVASGAEKQLESHRREITALFCDLRGFTGFSESSDPEDVMALLHEYHAAIGGIINKYGGTLERYAGDGVMVVFNDPIPIDNPALQAVLTAIDMRTAIGELIEKWRKLGHDIGFGIGIAHGFATLGTIGFEGRFDYAAIGTVSNVASRLCDEAKPGQILISPRVLMAVEKDITVEPVGDFALKGIRRPLTAYNVLDSKTAN